MQNHIVNSIRLELEVPTQDIAFELKHQVSSYLQELLINYLDRAFDKICSEDEIIRIQSLEFDLGEISFDDFEENFNQKLDELFIKELKKYQLENLSKNTSFIYEGSDIEQLAHFLKTGQLAWWIDKSKAIDWTRFVLDLFTQKPKALKSLFDDIFLNNNSTKRLIYQIDNQVLTDVFNHFYNTQQEISKLSAWLLKIKEITNFSSIQQTNIILTTITHLLGIKDTKTTENLLHFFLINISQVINNEAFTKIKKQYFHKEIALQKDDLEDDFNDFFKQNNDTDELEKIYLNQAGIMLIASWLPQLFEQLGFLENGQFKDKNSAYQAIYLVHFLATSETNVAEHELTLEKTLCGIAINEPIPINIVLSENELNEANELLQAAIDNWEILKTIAGLQQSFFIREGILYDKGENWELRIEQKAHDIVFEHRSPNWTLSHDFIAESMYQGATLVHHSSSKSFFYIHFSWMPKPIEIIW